MMRLLSSQWLASRHHTYNIWRKISCHMMMNMSVESMCEVCNNEYPFRRIKAHIQSKMHIENATRCGIPHHCGFLVVPNQMWLFNFSFIHKRMYEYIYIYGRQVADTLFPVLVKVSVMLSILLTIRPKGSGQMHGKAFGNGRVKRLMLIHWETFAGRRCLQHCADVNEWLVEVLIYKVSHVTEICLQIPRILSFTLRSTDRKS